MSTTDTGSLRDRTRQAIEEYADTLRRHRTQRARSMALGPLSGHLAALLTEWLASGGHDESRRRGDLAALEQSFGRPAQPVSCAAWTQCGPPLSARPTRRVRAAPCSWSPT